MLQRLKKFLGFGEVVDEARKGNLGRRGFLQAVVALGVLPEDADKELGKRVFAVPGPKLILNPWQDALLRGGAFNNVGAFAMVANFMSSEEGKWTVTWDESPPLQGDDLKSKIHEVAKKVGIVLPEQPKIEAPATFVAPSGGGIIQVGSSWK